MTPLRTSIIRLAHTNPKLRPHLLPLIREAKEDANTRYKARMAQIRDSLRKIERLLVKHEHAQKLNPRDWGFVGDLASVQDDYLDHILESLSNTVSRTAQ